MLAGFFAPLAALCRAAAAGPPPAAGPGQTRAVLIGLGCEKATIKVHGNKGF